MRTTNQNKQKTVTISFSNEIRRDEVKKKKAHEGKIGTMLTYAETIGREGIETYLDILEAETGVKIEFSAINVGFILDGLIDSVRYLDKAKKVKRDIFTYSQVFNAIKKQARNVAKERARK